MKLPSMPCARCGECCGVVPCTEAEFRTVRDYLENHEIVPRLQGISCPFLRRYGCAIYPARPIICRVFGHSPRLRCKHGHNVDVRDRNIRKLIARGGEPSRFLHELLDPPPDMMRLLEEYAAGSGATDQVNLDQGLQSETGGRIL